jgi:two-component system phosphate regulon response regulator OmpR
MQYKPYHLFVVEDDVALRDMLTAYFAKQGMVATGITSAEDFLRRLDRLRPDLVVLDVTLPGISGLQACQRLRAMGDQIPIILLTARTEEVDRVMGLEMGADDYLGKPFSARELLARTRAVLRRQPAVVGLPQPNQAAVSIGPRVFDTASRCLVGQDGAARVLNTVEYALLIELTANPGRPVSRERLLAASHDREVVVLPRTVDVAIMRLRKLVEPNQAEPRYIQTVRGHGYMFVPNASDSTP